MGGGGGESQGQQQPVAITWEKLLPPWTQAGQIATLPYLLKRAFGPGMTPEEERAITGQLRGEVERGTQTSLKAMAQKAALGGVMDFSPAVTGARGDILADRARNLADVGTQLQKLKMGAKETAINQLLQGLYTQPPYAVGQKGTTTSSQGK